jgi:hypothetical protein
VIDLHGIKLARDVEVSGTTDLMFEPNDVTMQVSVDGPRQVDGSLDVTGTFGGGPPFADFVVTGTVHGHHVHLTVPAN